MIWFTSDTHFFHANILRFTDSNGFLVRPGFEDVKDMNECIVSRWNSVVSPGDKVYHLGDVTFRYGPEFDDVMRRLNGKKRLLVGNHDHLKGTNLMNHFEKVELWKHFGKFVCTHVPSHEGSLFSTPYNVHGHIHQHPDPTARHLNVSVERTGYTPVSYDWIMARLHEREVTPGNADATV